MVGVCGNLGAIRGSEAPRHVPQLSAGDVLTLPPPWALPVGGDRLSEDASRTQENLPR